MSEYWTLRQEFYKKSLECIVKERNVPVSEATKEEIHRAQGISLLGLSSCQEYFADDDYIHRQGEQGISLAIQKIGTSLNFSPSPQDMEILAEVFHMVMKDSSAAWNDFFEEKDWDNLHHQISFRLIVPEQLKTTLLEDKLLTVVDDVLVDNSLPVAFTLQNEKGNLMMKKMYAVMGEHWNNSPLSESVWQKNGLGTSVLYPFLPQEESLFCVKDLQSSDQCISKIQYGGNNRNFYQSNMSNDLGYFEPPVSVFCRNIDEAGHVNQSPDNAYTIGDYNFTATLLMYVQIPESDQKLLIGKSNLSYAFENRRISIYLSRKDNKYNAHEYPFDILMKNPTRILFSGGTNILPTVRGKGFESILSSKLGEIAQACNIAIFQPHPQTVIEHESITEEHRKIQKEAWEWMLPPQKGLQIYDLPYDYKNIQYKDIVYPLKVKLLGRDILTSSRSGIYDFKNLYEQEHFEISTDAYRYLIENGLIERRQKELGFFDNFKRKIGAVPEEVVSDVNERELEFLATFHPHFNAHLQFMLKRGVPANILAQKRNDMMKRYLEVLDWNQNGYWTVSNQVVRAMKQIPLKNREMIPDEYPLGNLRDNRNSKDWNASVEKFLDNLESEVNKVCKMGRFAQDTYRLGNTLERMGIVKGQIVGSSRAEKYYQYTYDLPLVAMMQEMWKTIPEFVLKPDMGNISSFPEELKKWLPKEIPSTAPNPIKPVLKS